MSKKEGLSDYLSRTGYANKKLAESNKSQVVPNKNSFPKKYIFFIILLLGATIYFFSDNNEDQTQQVVPLEQNLNSFSGTLVGMIDPGFILEKDGINFTIIPNAPINRITLTKILVDGSPVKIKWEDLKIGNKVTIFGSIENGQKVLTRVVVNAEN